MALLSYCEHFSAPTFPDDRFSHDIVPLTSTALIVERMITFAHHFLHSSNQNPIRSTFPLCRLPLLPILNVFSSLNSVELFNLSRTSTKLRGFIKNTRIWKRLEINLVFRSDCFSFLIWSGKTVHHINVFPREFRHFFYNDFSNEGAGKEAKVWYNERDTVTYWNDSVMGIETIGNYLLEMFDEPKITITVLPNAVPFIESVVHWLKNRNIRELTVLSVNGFSKNVGEIYCILKYFIVRRGLFINNVELDYSWIRWHLRNLGRVTIRKSELLTINDILIMDPEILCLYDSSLTSQDLNRFLKNWKNGNTNSRMKYFRVITKTSPNKQQVLMDVEGVERSQNITRSYFFKENFVWQKEISAGGFDIERSVGIKATIHVGLDGFRIAIWPDFRGNMA